MAGRETWYRGSCVYRRTDAAGPNGEFPPYVSLRQVDTVRFLRAACADAGITISWDTELRHLTAGATGVHLETTPAS